MYHGREQRNADFANFASARPGPVASAAGSVNKKEQDIDDLLDDMGPIGSSAYDPGPR